MPSDDGPSKNYDAAIAVLHSELEPIKSHVQRVDRVLLGTPPRFEDGLPARVNRLEALLKTATWLVGIATAAIVGQAALAFATWLSPG